MGLLSNKTKIQALSGINIQILCVIGFVMMGSGCYHYSKNDRYLVLKYEEFGPQSMAWQLIGMQWWQWQQHGDSNPNSRYDIKVVVYRDIPVETVAQYFQVSVEKQKDFRYVKYSDAKKYLEKNIRELQHINHDWSNILLGTFNNTKIKIENVFTR